MSDKSRWFGGLGQASASRGGVYVNPGVYTVRVEDIVRRDSQNPSTQGHMLYIVELTILRTLVAHEAEPGADGKNRFEASNKEGTRASVIINLSANRATSLGNVKNFLCALLAMEEGDLTDDQWQEVAWRSSDPTLDASERGIGVELLCTGSKTTTRAGKPFTVKRFAPLPETNEAADA